MPYMLAFIFFIGLFFGSFFNVVALRTLSNEKMALPPSHCTTCNHRLYPWDLVPVFSWLFLGGKCRYCKEKISYIYPFGEILTASAFAIVFYRFGFSLEALVHLVFIIIMIIATVTDLKETMVPDRFVVIGLILVLILRLIIGDSVGAYILSSIGSFGVLYLFFLLSGGKMGGADIKLYALIGLAMGFLPAMGTLFYASFIGLLVNVPLLILKKQGKEFEIPFVPFITLGILGIYIFNIYEYIIV